MNASGAARALGWFSVAFGVAELVAPGALSRALGTTDRRPLLRTLGLREVATGVGLLTTSRPAPWLWARVAGDVIDLGALGLGFARASRARNRVALAAASVVAIAVVDALLARRLAGRG